MKLNLHAHTKYSDGANTMWHMADMAKKLGHVAFVATDHDYMMTPEKYEDAVRDAAQITAGGFLCVAALEISIVYDEAALIGTEACRAWLKAMTKAPQEGYFASRENYYQERREYQLAVLHDIVRVHRCALILVHPGGAPIPALFQVLDAYEIMNSGTRWDKSEIDVLAKLMPSARQVIGMDAHSSAWMRHETMSACNDVDFLAKTEEDIIRWVKQED